MTSPENKQDEVYKIPPAILILAIINLNNCSFFFFYLGHECLSIAQIPIPLAGVNINIFLSGVTLY